MKVAFLDLAIDFQGMVLNLFFTGDPLLLYFVIRVPMEHPATVMMCTEIYLFENGTESSLRLLHAYLILQSIFVKFILRFPKRLM